MGLSPWNYIPRSSLWRTHFWVFFRENWLNFCALVNILCLFVKHICFSNCKFLGRLIGPDSCSTFGWATASLLASCCYCCYSEFTYSHKEAQKERWINAKMGFEAEFFFFFFREDYHLLMFLMLLLDCFHKKYKQVFQDRQCEIKCF